MKFTTTGGGTSILSKSASEMLALTGTDGQIIYNSTYKHPFIYIVNRWVPLGDPDPRYGFIVKDEFLSTSGTFDMNWGNVATVSTGTSLDTASGLCVLRQATAGSRASISQNAAGIMLGTMDVYQEWNVRFPTLATGAEDYCFAVGFNDAGAYDANGAATDGAYFTYNRAVNGANWNIHTAANSVLTNTTNITSAILADTFYRLSILVQGTTSAKFYVNGTLIGTHTTNLPSGVGRATQFQARVDKTLGSANSDAWIDYFYGYAFYNGARVA